MKARTYFETMRQISKSTRHILEKAIAEEDEGIGYRLIRRRLDKPKLRDILTYASYKLVSNHDSARIYPVCAAMELFNCSTYAYNWILDQKEQVQTLEDINKLIIAGMQMREKSEELLFSYGDVELIQKFSETNKKIYDAQYLDIFKLTYEKFSNASMTDFENLYEKRLKNITGHFIGLCCYSGAAVGGDKETAEILHKYGVLLGTAGQLINDLGDFVASSQKVLEKSYKDQFSDIRQGKLTLAAKYLLSHGTKQEQKSLTDLIGNTKPKIEEMERCQSAIVTSGAAKYVMERSKHYRNTAKKVLHQLPASHWRNLLSVASVHTRTNKYTKKLFL